MVALLKKDGSLRPIAVGEVFRRLVSKCCTRAVTAQAASYLSPLQLGVGVSHGAEAVLHAINRSLDYSFTSSDTVLALVDFQNAFNQVNRNKFLEIVYERFPQIFAWNQYTYGVKASIFSGSDMFMANAGVQQGDSLGPLLKCYGT
jgi:hypothetical protein